MPNKLQTPLAHVRQNPDGSWETHSLEEHLRQVALLAKHFAAPFHSGLWGERGGRWHDLGKYIHDFQHYIKSASGYDPEAHIETTKGRVDHSTAGAQLAIQQMGLAGRVLAYIIAGHHAGLPDWYADEASGGALFDRLSNPSHLNKTLEQSIPADILKAEPFVEKPVGGREGFALWVRMLFSCLVDADFLDTEAFMDSKKGAVRSRYPDISELREFFNTHMAKLAQDAEDTPVNRIRAEILDCCRRKAQAPPGSFSLTVPTGGGKTLSSMAFALEHAQAHGKRRVIYAIPYTSIIEQTADIFRSIFGDVVIEHHSNADTDGTEKENSKSRLAAENWDAPIIVTTNVQFFESLFAARTSRCRKLHNIVGSVVVLDETQLLPTEFLQPILCCMDLLSRYYDVTFVLSTATQPALSSQKSSFGQTLLKGLENVSEIMEDSGTLYRRLERVSVTMPEDFHAHRSWEEIAEAINREDSVLAIVNTRRDARELHALMPRGTYHLSALMCGEHRSRVLAKIKARLKEGDPIRVVSTQLVEAGVDIDFPVVYRALAGLDSIAQAAGRCNREGKLVEKGRLVVFVPPHAAPPGHLRRAEQTTVSLLANRNENPLEPHQFFRFFEQFYAKNDLDKHCIMKLLAAQGEGQDDLKVQFRTAALKFKMIEESDYQTVYVRYGDEAKGLLGKLKNGGPERWLMRKLQRYAVNLPHFHWKPLLESQDIVEIWPGIYAQHTDTLYDPTLGLMLSGTSLSVESLIL